MAIDLKKDAGMGLLPSRSVATRKQLLQGKTLVFTRAPLHTYVSALSSWSPSTGVFLSFRIAAFLFCCNKCLTEHYRMTAFFATQPDRVP